MTGEILKKRREDLNLNIREISELLRIKADYLIAIENNLFEKLPVQVYTKGYIRSYAEYLDIDPEPIILYYSNNLTEPEPSTIVPVDFSKKKRSKFFYIIPVFFAAFVTFFIFSSMSEKQTEKSSPGIKKVPAVKPVNTHSADNFKNYKSLPEEKEHSLHIKANEVTWIFIKFGNGQSDEILLQPGESKNWIFFKKALLKIGNTGGVTLNFDGKDLGVLGKSGQVITLSLPENE